MSDLTFRNKTEKDGYWYAQGVKDGRKNEASPSKEEEGGYWYAQGAKDGTEQANKIAVSLD